MATTFIIKKVPLFTIFIEGSKNFIILFLLVKWMFFHFSLFFSKFSSNSVKYDVTLTQYPNRKFRDRINENKRRRMCLTCFKYTVIP